MPPICLQHNGAAVSSSAAPTTKLLWVLREELGDTSARFGCGQALCGSCMVTVDGRAMHSCDVPLWAVENKDVQTAQGLPDAQIGRVLIDAFDELQAGQCGYCLPGILMAAKALLEHDAAPGRERIGQALARNLCRCGAHTRILAAIELAGRRISSLREGEP